MKRLGKICVECTSPAISRNLCAIHYNRHHKAGTLDQFKRVYLPLSERTAKRANGCIEWLGDRTSSGYGSIQIGYHPRVRVAAHRFFYERKHGAIPDGMMVCHKCDNRLCVNLRHLFLGSGLVNARDAAQKNRMAVGEKHGSAKLNTEQVLEILRSPESGRAMARKLNVSHATVSEIRRREIRVKEFVTGSNNGRI